MTNDGLELIRKQVRLKSAVSLESLYAQRAALVDYIDELHGIVHDLRQEPGYALGRQDVLREVLDVLGKVPVKWNADHTKGVADPQSLAIVLDLIECLGPVAPHLAPDDLRRENEALRAVLRDVYDVLADAIPHPEDVDKANAASAEARRLLHDV